MATLSQPSPAFSFRAHNTAADSENKIHDDQVAAAYGFRGGLVPGVTVYGYMVPAVLECFGRDWLEHGSIAFRLHAPCYEGDVVLTRCNDSEVKAEQEDGSLYASGVVSLNAETVKHSALFPHHPLPEMENRPVASSSTVLSGMPLGSIQATLDVEDVNAIPERLLRMANEILVRNFRMSPWIHAGSQVRHHQLAACGEEIVVNGLIRECFERKGRKFAVADLEMLAGRESSSTLIATVRHTFIYQL